MMIEKQAENSLQLGRIRDELIEYSNESKDLEFQAHAFYDFYKLLKARNQDVRLVSNDKFEEFLYRHVCDSLSLLKTMDIRKNDIIMDIGSGAGFPGIPIKIIKSEIRLISIESVSKKASFQTEIVYSLGLKNVDIINSRAEDIAGTDLRGKADVVISRAVASTAVLSELALPLLRIGGIAVFYKGSIIEEEYESAKNAITLCGGDLDYIYKYKVRPEDPERSLLLVKKVIQTPEKYPRKPGIPFKRPL
jgi:16S rRNA (guanine527-N7)-methyltransferase